MPDKPQGKITPAPREHKVLPIYVLNTDEVQGIVEAIVNVFGIVDLGDDIIHTGAYTRTLNERGNQVRVKVLDSHNTDSIMRVIGKPLEIREIGKEELKSLAPKVLEDYPEATGGLYTRTQYLLNTPEGDGAFKRIASQAVNEYSIALDPLDVDYSKVSVDGKEKTVRNIRTIRLWEYSPVIFGMNQATVTTDVKAADDKADPAPMTQKQATLDAGLEADLRGAYGWRISCWLACGTIDGNLADELDTAFKTSMTAFRTALPDGLPEMPEDDSWELWNGHGGGDRKQATLGTMLEADLRMAYNCCVNDWLEDGVIDTMLLDALDAAFKVGLTALRDALPMGMANLPVAMYTAPTIRTAKAGRMISGANREIIQAAIDALQALMDASMPAQTDSATPPAEEKSQGEVHASPVTGSEKPEAAPSITDAAEIDRELSELEVMMEMTA